mgnify:CR=1 FL=1|jgi:hypothetical protein
MPWTGVGEPEGFAQATGNHLGVLGDQRRQVVTLELEIRAGRIGVARFGDVAVDRGGDEVDE